MHTPRSRMEQRNAHIRGEIIRGCGIWPTWGIECTLEPPFEPFEWNGITAWDLAVNGFDSPYQGLFADRLKRLFQPLLAEPFSQYYRRGERDGIVHVINVATYAEDKVTYAKAEQLLLALSPAKEPIAFELFGIGEGSHEFAGPPRIQARFIASGGDIALLEAQLHNHYPRSAVATHEWGYEDEDCEWEDRIRSRAERADPVYVAPLFLEAPYCFPIRIYPGFDADPLGVPLAVMDELRRDEWALVTVLFTRTKELWADNLRAACEDRYNPGKPVDSSLDLKLLALKLETPLFAVAITLAANSPRVLSRLQAFVHQYETARNHFEIRDVAVYQQQWADSEPPTTALWREALTFRQAVVPGMLLSARELAGMVHLPSEGLPTERLVRVRTQTRKAPRPVLKASSIVLGENTHRGQVQQVSLPLDTRLRHCYIAGASGTGKSTLLLNMVLQDITAGHGVGLLDPHGDLLKEVLLRIPENRIDDVILFDPVDTEYPFALNILEARGKTERERIVAETVATLQRYFPASWGARLERILKNTIRTVLRAVPGATLADVERMLTNPDYRKSVLEKTTDQRLREYWTMQFKHLRNDAMDPVLNRLSVFLSDDTIRNIVCQRHAAIDFDRLLNDGKILLANLSFGLLTETIAGTLGSFLVTKIVNAAFRRASMPEEERRPWFLYIDEFQSFMNLSVGFERILAEARKYRLVLAGLANQYVGQLNPEVKQAIFGNVGTFVVFRLGVDDANSVAKQMGVFTMDDILNLEIGQAIARVGPASSAFNLRTFMAPPLPANDPRERIVALARQRYARPRAEVEAELEDVKKHIEQREVTFSVDDDPTDPSEDDLVT